MELWQPKPRNVITAVQQTALEAIFSESITRNRSGLGGGTALAEFYL